jgi:hypothetical protein
MVRRSSLAMAVIALLVFAGCGSGRRITRPGNNSNLVKAQSSGNSKSCEQAARAIEGTELTHINEGRKSGELSESTAAALEGGAAERESSAIEKCKQALK